MAKLTALPHLSIINGFKGVLDFYVNMGIPCVRRWPRSPGRRRAPLVEAQWAAFTYITKLWTTIPPEIKQAWHETAVGTNLTGRDLFQKAYRKDYFREGQWD